MQPILIDNFCGHSPLQIRTIEQPEAQPLIALTQFAGAVSFQHAMTVEQAKDMAKHLLELAYSFELEAIHE